MSIGEVLRGLPWLTRGELNVGLRTGHFRGVLTAGAPLLAGLLGRALRSGMRRRGMRLGRLAACSFFGGLAPEVLSDRGFITGSSSSLFCPVTLLPLLPLLLLVTTRGRRGPADTSRGEAAGDDLAAKLLPLLLMVEEVALKLRESMREGDAE